MIAPMPNPPAPYRALRTMTGRNQQTTHLIPPLPDEATPLIPTGDDTLCGRTRFDQRDRATWELVRAADIPGWSVGGGVEGLNVEQVECASCWRNAKREIRHAKDAAYYAAQHEASMKRHADIVEAALNEYDCVGGMPWDQVARIAVDALDQDGVIFARFNGWGEPGDG